MGPVVASRSAVGFASAGVVAESTSYRMVFTLGEATMMTGKSESQSYSLRAGVIGAAEVP